MKPKAQYESYYARGIRQLERDLRSNRVVAFKYRKANGQFRYARGRIPRKWADRMGVAITKDGGEILIYWDIDRGAVRSFYTINLL
jgi:hypothetical protein